MLIDNNKNNVNIITVDKRLSDVIKFAYKDLKQLECDSEGEKIPKWSAVCNSCGLKSN